jgi:di/tricarboxylate transporter
MSGISYEAVLVAVLTVGSLGLLISGRMAMELVGTGLLIALVVTGILGVESALAGFSSSTVITLAGLYVIGEGLTRTGALGFANKWLLLKSRGNVTRILLLLCLTSAALSALVSDTAVVLVLLPVCLDVARSLSVPVSRLLIPVAYSALLGGTVTLVGSSINLLASAAAERSGAPPLSMFEQTPIGLPVAIAGVLVIVLLSRRLLPDRTSLTSTLSELQQSRDYVTEVVIGPTSPFLGKKVSEAFSAQEARVSVLIRGQEMVWPPFGDQTLQTGDCILLSGNVAQLLELQERLGLRIVGDQRFDPKTMSFFELAVAPHSGVLGRTVAELNLRRDLGVAVVAILRAGHHLRERASELALRPGDLLLVCGDEESQSRVRASRDFFVLAGTRPGPVPRRLMRRALGILGLMVLLFSTAPLLGLEKLAPLPVVALAGALAMVFTGCLDTRRAITAIDFPVLLFVVGTLALGQAIRTTGLAAECARGVIALLQGFGPGVVASGLMLLGTLLNLFISPYAVTVLLMPIAIATAESLGVSDVRPFILAIVYSGSNAFTNPMGHQVNLMVMGPGGYRYRDFLRLGIPLSLFVWLVVSLGLIFRLW